MPRIALAASFAASALSLSGCGTLCNFGASALPPPDSGKAYPAVYGGVQFDPAVLTSSRDSPIASPGADAKAVLLICGCLLTDVPLSFVGDTLTLPITLAIERARAAPESDSRSLTDPEVRTNAPVGSLAEQALAEQKRRSVGMPAPFDSPFPR